VLTRHADATARLVAEDLRSREPEAVARASVTIAALKLGNFLDELVAIYLGGGASADAARSALGTLNDPRAAGPLIADIEKNPAALARHHLLLNGMLDGKPADPVLVRLLSSKDAGVRLQAATALGYCRDDALAPHVLKLLKDPDARVRAGAVRMVFRLPKDGFASVRGDLVGVARDADPEVRLELACGLAARKDPTAAYALLELWRAPEEPKESWRVMQAVSTLTGETFGYNPREWGPGKEENRKAIAKLEQWARAHAL